MSDMFPEIQQLITMYYSAPIKLTTGQNYCIPKAINCSPVYGAIVTARLQIFKQTDGPNCVAFIRGYVGPDKEPSQEIASAACVMLPHGGEGIIPVNENTISFPVQASGSFRVDEQISQKNDAARCSSSVFLTLVMERMQKDAEIDTDSIVQALQKQ